MIYDDPDEFLDSKLWRMLQIFFGPIQQKVQQPEQEAGIDSESDYEDELACQ